MFKKCKVIGCQYMGFDEDTSLDEYGTVAYAGYCWQHAGDRRKADLLLKEQLEEEEMNKNGG